MTTHEYKTKYSDNLTILKNEIAQSSTSSKALKKAITAFEALQQNGAGTKAEWIERINALGACIHFTRRLNEEDRPWGEQEKQMLKRLTLSRSSPSLSVSDIGIAVIDTLATASGMILPGVSSFYRNDQKSAASVSPHDQLCEALLAFQVEIQEGTQRRLKQKIQENRTDKAFIYPTMGNQATSTSLNVREFETKLTDQLRQMNWLPNDWSINITESENIGRECKIKYQDQSNNSTSELGLKFEPTGNITATYSPSSCTDESSRERAARMIIAACMAGKPDAEMEVEIKCSDEKMLKALQTALTEYKAYQQEQKVSANR